MEAKNYDKAQLELDTVITKWKDYSNAYSLKAEVYLHQKDTVQAEKWLDQSLKLNPYDGDAWITRAYMALARKEWKVADEALTKSLHFAEQCKQLHQPSIGSYQHQQFARCDERL